MKLFPPHLKEGEDPALDKRNPSLSVAERIPTQEEIWAFMIAERKRKMRKYKGPSTFLVHSFSSEHVDLLGRLIDEVFVTLPSELRSQVALIRCNQDNPKAAIVRDVFLLRSGRLFYRRHFAMVYDRGPNIFPVDDVSKLTLRLDLGWTARGGYYFPRDWPQPDSIWPPLLTDGRPDDGPTPSF